jgi:hypothetical protein
MVKPWKEWAMPKMREIEFPQNHVFSKANSYDNKNVKYIMCMHCSYLFFLV